MVDEKEKAIEQGHDPKHGAPEAEGVLHESALEEVSGGNAAHATRLDPYK